MVSAQNRLQKEVEMKVKTIATIVLACTATLAFGSSGAKAADVTVGLGRCVSLGGQTTVPAGSMIIGRLRVFEVNRGMVHNYLQAQRTTFSIDGAQPVDLSDGYDGDEAVEGGGWSTAVFYSTGITLANVGDSVTVTYLVTVKRNLVETLNSPLNFSEGGTPGPPLFTAAGDLYTTGTCTITAE
jgi:hypothetical protein